MAFTKKATYLKQEFEYKSHDGEIYLVTVVESYGKMYVQWTNPVKKNDETSNIDKQENAKDVVIVDAEMIKGLYEILCEVVGGHNKSNKSSLQLPRITDHRNNEQNLTRIDKQAAKTMKNFNNNNRPIESFHPSKPKDESVFDNAESTEVVRSGVDITAIGEVEETPDDFKAELENIQGDVQQRINKDTGQRIENKGDAGANFRRMDASQLV